MAIERADVSEGGKAKGGRPGVFGTLRDALMAAGREDATPDRASPVPAQRQPSIQIEAKPISVIELPATPVLAADKPAASLSEAEAARQARGEQVEPPTTRVVRGAGREATAQPRTQLVRGRQPIVRDQFVQDPVVGFLVVVGGPGLGAARTIFEGNNTIGRSRANRIPLDFGDDSISAEAQAYVRYDSTDRSFLFVPNLAKTNVVSVNDKRPTGAVELKPMDVLTLGRTQVAFLPFCGPDFDWSELTENQDE